MKKPILEIIFVLIIVGLVVWDRIPTINNSPALQEQAKELNAGKNLPPIQFSTDGCTLWPDSLFNYSWQKNCIEHDMKYWEGGTEQERLQADITLRDEVNKVLPGMGDIVYLGVRIGGRSLSPLMPWPWGWGFGWNSGVSSTAETLFGK